MRDTLKHDPILDTTDYLASTDATSSIHANCYWPKWHSPWWHMLALHEMGQARRIPKPALEQMVQSIQKLPPVFFQADVPQGMDPAETPCHCQLGNIYQALSAAGVDVDARLPWIRPWFMRYQMTDGGLNCDEDAYRANPQASSMVATIAPLEAVLFYTPRPFTAGEIEFIDRGARCLLDRELRLGCSAKHNIEEQEDEQDWLKPCSPRFYFYDVLRGLSFILHWSEKRRQPFSSRSIDPVAGYLAEKFPDGQILVGRQPYTSVGRRTRSETGEWQRSPATSFALFDQVSEVGTISPYPTAQWSACRRLIVKLKAEGLVT